MKYCLLLLTGTFYTLNAHLPPATTPLKKFPTSAGSQSTTFAAATKTSGDIKHASEAQPLISKQTIAKTFAAIDATKKFEAEKHASIVQLEPLVRQAIKQLSPLFPIHVYPDLLRKEVKDQWVYRYVNRIESHEPINLRAQTRWVIGYLSCIPLFNQKGNIIAEITKQFPSRSHDERIEAATKILTQDIKEKILSIYKKCFSGNGVDLDTTFKTIQNNFTLLRKYRDPAVQQFLDQSASIIPEHYADPEKQTIKKDSSCVIL